MMCVYVYSYVNVHFQFCGALAIIYTLSLYNSFLDECFQRTYVAWYPGTTRRQNILFCRLWICQS